MARRPQLDLRTRLAYGVVNTVDRYGTRPIVVGVNRVLPRVAALGRPRRGYRWVRDLVYRHVEGRALRLDLFLPLQRAGARAPVLLGFHGGAWILGRKENLQHVGAVFARAGFVTALVQYRLAPRHRFPACVEDAEAALAWLHTHGAVYGGDPGRIGVFGDSAGGHLSAYLAVRSVVPGSGIPQVGAAVHWYGVFDFERFARVPYRRTPQIMRALFTAEGAQDPELLAAASPVHHLATAGALPPTLLFVGDRDPLLGQSRRYARLLEARGDRVELVHYPGAVHGFVNLWWQRVARDSLRRAIAWFATHLGTAAS